MTNNGFWILFWECKSFQVSIVCDFVFFPSIELKDAGNLNPRCLLGGTKTRPQFNVKTRNSVFWVYWFRDNPIETRYGISRFVHLISQEYTDYINLKGVPAVLFMSILWFVLLLYYSTALRFVNLKKLEYWRGWGYLFSIAPSTGYCISWILLCYSHVNASISAFAARLSL